MRALSSVSAREGVEKRAEIGMCGNMGNETETETGIGTDTETGIGTDTETGIGTDRH